MESSVDLLPVEKTRKARAKSEIPNKIKTRQTPSHGRGHRFFGGQSPAGRLLIRLSPVAPAIISAEKLRFPHPAEKLLPAWRFGGADRSG
jgi:hypothetical protein